MILKRILVQRSLIFFIFLWLRQLLQPGLRSLVVRHVSPQNRFFFWWVCFMVWLRYIDKKPSWLTSNFANIWHQRYKLTYSNINAAIRKKCVLQPISVGVDRGSPTPASLPHYPHFPPPHPPLPSPPTSLPLEYFPRPHRKNHTHTHKKTGHLII